jgi:hypothetical protein
VNDDRSFPLEMQQRAQHADAFASGSGIQCGDRERHLASPERLSQMEVAQQTDRVARIF